MLIWLVWPHVDTKEWPTPAVGCLLLLSSLWRSSFISAQHGNLFEKFVPCSTSGNPPRIQRLNWMAAWGTWPIHCTLKVVHSACWPCHWAQCSLMMIFKATFFRKDLPSHHRLIHYLCTIKGHTRFRRMKHLGKVILHVRIKSSICHFSSDLAKFSVSSDLKLY